MAPLTIGGPMSQLTRQRLFISLVALLNLFLAAVLVLNHHDGLPLAVIGIVLLPLAWLTGRQPSVSALPLTETDNHAA